MIKKYKSLILYGIFGIATTLVNIIAYFICAKVFNLSVVVSTCIAWFIAVIFAFVTNKIWVFESKKNKFKDVSKGILSFFSCRILTGLLDLLIMYVFVDKLHFNDLLFKVLSNVIVIVLNYVASKLIIFKKNDNNENKKVNLKCDWQEILTIIVIFGIATIFSLNSPTSILTDGGGQTDSSVFRFMGMLLAKGYMPYLDSFDHKGPIIYILNYLGYIINRNWGIWLIELIFLFFSFLFIYKIARFNNKKVASIIVLLLTTINLFDYYQGGNLTEEFALLFIIVALYIFLDYLINNKTTNLKIIISGMCFACVCLLRINMITCWIVFCLTILIKCLKEKKYKELFNYILNFLIGSLIIIVPIILWLICKGAFLKFIDDYFLFNFIYVSDGGKFEIWKAMFHYLNNFIVLFSIVINIYSIVKENKKEIYITNIIFTILSLFMISMSGRSYPHYAMVLIPCFIIPISYFVSKILNDKYKELAIFFIIYIISIYALPLWSTTVENAGIYFRNKRNNEICTLIELEVDIRDAIINNSNKNDKILVYGNWNILYVISDRLSASTYSYQFPIMEISTDIQNEFYADINKNKPEIIVIQYGYNFEERMKNFIAENKYKEIYNKDNKFLVYKLSK